MAPVTIATLPRDAPSACVYLFSENGRSFLRRSGPRNLRQRLRQHSIPSSQHNQAVFAFRLAREATGRLIAAYSGVGRRAATCDGRRGDSAGVLRATPSVGSGQCRLGYVDETDPLRQALLRDLCRRGSRDALQGRFQYALIDADRGRPLNATRQDRVVVNRCATNRILWFVVGAAKAYSGAGEHASPMFSRGPYSSHTEGESAFRRRLAPRCRPSPPESMSCSCVTES